MDLQAWFWHALKAIQFTSVNVDIADILNKSELVEQFCEDLELDGLREHLFHAADCGALGHLLVVLAGEAVDLRLLGTRDADFLKELLHFKGCFHSAHDGHVAFHEDQLVEGPVVSVLDQSEGLLSALTKGYDFFRVFEAESLHEVHDLVDLVLVVVDQQNLLGQVSRELEGSWLREQLHSSSVSLVLVQDGDAILLFLDLLELVEDWCVILIQVDVAGVDARHQVKFGLVSDRLEDDVLLVQLAQGLVHRDAEAE